MKEEDPILFFIQVPKGESCWYRPLRKPVTQKQLLKSKRKKRTPKAPSIKKMRSSIYEKLGFLTAVKAPAAVL